MAKGRYRIIRKIADGGMAEIFAGTQHGVEGFERPVVLKRILPALLVEPQFKNLMIDEAHVAMSLSHSNIVQVLDLGQAKGSYYLVLELVDGWDLNNILTRLKTLPSFELPATLRLFIVTEVCRALAYAHSRRRGGQPMGIVHRDVSPHNVLVSAEGEVKLTDFGIAKAMVRRENTVQGVIKGKLAFMSPEQASGTAIDARSDLFSVGTLLYLMFTGKRPFEAATDLESILRVQKADFPPPEVANPAVSAPVAQVIKRAMKLDPNDRYQSADGMLEAIEEVQRQVFGAAGKTELKRWLAELESRDHVPSIARLPAPPSRGPDETMELGDHDIEFEASSMAPAPVVSGVGATMAAAGSASAADDPSEDGKVGEEVAFAPTSQTVSARPASPEASSEMPRKSSRRGVIAAMALGGSAFLAGMGLWAMRRKQDSAPPTQTDPLSRPQELPAAVEPAVVETSAPRVDAASQAVAEAPGKQAEAPPSATSPAQNTGADEAASSELDEDENEELLLAQAEPDATAKIIGEDPEDHLPHLPPPSAPKSRSRAVGAKRPPEKPPEAPPAVSVKVVSKPTGAVVKLRNRVFGRAPMNLRFRAGNTYELSFVKQGYHPTTKRVTVSRRKNQTVAVALRKRKATKKKNFLQRMFGL